MVEIPPPTLLLVRSSCNSNHGQKVSYTYIKAELLALASSLAMAQKCKVLILY